MNNNNNNNVVYKFSVFLLGDADFESNEVHSWFTSIPVICKYSISLNHKRRSSYFSIMLLVIVLVAVGSYILWELLIRWFEPRSLPPGERLFPFSTIFRPTDGVAPHERLAEMTKKYDDVFTIKRGREVLVFVNSISGGKEALQNRGNDFAGRAWSHASSLLTKAGIGVVCSDFGPTWKLHHRIMYSAMHMNSSESFSLEEKICKEVDSLAERFKEAMKEPFDPKYKIYLAVVNTFCATLFGNRYKINDPEFYEIVELNNRLRKVFNNRETLDIFPFLKYFPVELINDINEVISFRDRLFKRKLQEHRSAFLNASIRDLTDALLKAVDDERSEISRIKPDETVTDDNLIAMIMDVFSAGVDAVSSSLCWALVYLLSHPHVQTNIHRELDDVIGRNRLPCLSDRSRLPYLEAVIHETLRIAPPFPMSIPHKALTNSRLLGYIIPTGSSVIFNFWAIHRDARQWEHPDEFRPERFLDSEGKLSSLSSKSYLPFGFGPRACLGQSLAMSELFLFLSRLTHEFRFSVPPGCDPYGIQGTAGVVREPKPFRIFVAKR